MPRAAKAYGYCPHCGITHTPEQCLRTRMPVARQDMRYKKRHTLQAGNLIAYQRSYSGHTPPRWVLIADGFMRWKRDRPY
jgi:hypothetical protein